MSLIKKVLGFLFILLLMAQFFRPEKNEGRATSFDAFLLETKPSESVERILKKACFDCHSNVTHYPWYNNITPVNYWLENHIRHGKKHFNVSNWTGNSTKRKDHKFEELIEVIEDKSMPLKSYTWLHNDAKLNDAEIKAVLDWAKLVRLKYSLEKKPE